MRHLWLLAFAATAAVADRDATQHQALDRLQEAMVAHRNSDVLALADTIITETETSLKGEKRRVYSSQTVAATLLDLAGAAADKADAVDIGPAYGFALFAKGFALEDLNQPEQAGAYLDRAVAVSPHTSQFLCEDGYWHAHHRDPAGALDLYRRCESDSGLAAEDRRSRWKAAGLRGQGFALIDLGKLDEAEARYRDSLAIEPNDTHALGDLRYIASRKYSAAQSH